MFLKRFIYLVCVCVCVCATCANLKRPEESSRSSGAGVTISQESSIWVLGIKLRASGRTASPLTHHAYPPGHPEVHQPHGFVGVALTPVGLSCPWRTSVHIIKVLKVKCFVVNCLRMEPWGKQEENGVMGGRKMKPETPRERREPSGMGA